MEFSAITHFGDKRYCFAMSKDHFVIRIKTKKNDMKEVILHYQDKYLPLKIMDTRRTAVMKKVCFDHFCDYYEVELEFSVVCLRYYFELTDYEGNTKYYGNLQFFDEPITSLDYMYDCPQNLREEEMLLVPEWAKNAVVYQIFPTRFATTEAVPEEEWYQTPIDGRVNLKGNLRGIINKLEYLHDLGIDVVYLTPIFRSDSSHKYDTYDYYLIDPSLGTKEDLKELVEKAHSLSMKVMLDGVFNHTSQKFFAFSDIVQNEEKSKYLNWYFIEGFPLIMEWGKKPNYKCFSYFGGMPKLNLKNPEVEKYFVEVGCYWIKECNIDGWRLDVADEISHRFWKQFRKAIKEIKPDAMIVGEIWHYAADFLEGDEWDSVMNYDFMNNALELVARNHITVSQFVENLGFMRGNLHPYTYQVLWNHLDTHDTCRFLHQTGNVKSKQKIAASLQLLLAGSPMIYYGDECAIGGAFDPDCRRGMLWDANRIDDKMFTHYRRLLELRREYPELLTLDLCDYKTDDEKALITLETNHVIAIWHCAKEKQELSCYKGYLDLVTGKKFNGIVGAFQTMVLKKA